jgi:hypothetical protein
MNLKGRIAWILFGERRRSSQTEQPKMMTVVVGPINWSTVEDIKVRHELGTVKNEIPLDGWNVSFCRNTKAEEETEEEEADLKLL